MVEMDSSVQLDVATSPLTVVSMRDSIRLDLSVGNAE